ncbi:MAG: CotH kinase family protein [Clostridia bacterium]|nr:CotH kinase family protein [Clostridia bacterium]
MKKALAALMSLCLFVVLLCVPSFAAKAPAEEEGDMGVLSDVLGALDTAYVGSNTKLYVKADKKAGLSTKTKVQFQYEDLNGAVYFPGDVDPSGMCFSWDDPDLTLSKGGKTYQSGKAPIAKVGQSVTYTTNNGAVLTIKTVRGSSTVGSLFLTVDEKKGTIKSMNNDPDHEKTCYGKAMFDGKTKYMSIKGRGNSTWILPKKPYNITFYDDASYDSKDGVKMVKDVKAKKWSLVANYFDNSLLRNKIAMDLADNLGIGMKTRFMDVWMNGTYLGNYLVTPKNDYNTPDNGYALENDNYVDPDSFQIPGMFEINSVPGVSIMGSGYFNRITVKDVGDTAKANGTTKKTIEKHFLNAWEALEDYDSEAYQQYFDMDSWAKMYLMYEVAKIYDCYAGSLLMHRDGLSKNDKLIAGPAWDYDVAFGRTLHKFFVGVSEPMQINAEGWYIDHIGMDLSDQPISLLQELGKHKSFRQHVNKIYQEYEWAFKDCEANVGRQAVQIRDSALMNNVRWVTNNLCAEYVVAPNTMRAIGTGKYKLNYRVTTSWTDYVDNLAEWCNKRVLWLSDHTNS